MIFLENEFELEVFNRYNKGTKALTPQEIRNAVYASPHNEHISDFVKQIYEGDSERDKKLRNIFNVSKDRIAEKKGSRRNFQYSICSRVWYSRRI